MIKTITFSLLSILGSATAKPLENEAEKTSDFSGLWELSAFIESDEETPFKESKTLADQEIRELSLVMPRWNLLPEKKKALKPIKGMELTIKPSGKMSEEKTDPSLKMTWFDFEGVLDIAATPFDCEVLEKKKLFVVYANNDIMPTQVTELRNNPEKLVRINDGDTLILESLFLYKGNLYRSCKALTDGIYLNCCLYQYKRKGTPLQ